MSKRSDHDFLSDIREALQRIEEYSHGLTYEQFISDLKTQDAVVRNLEIIGEAAKNVSDTFRRQHPNIAWSELAKLRDKLIHHYFGVNFDIVWDVISEYLPEIKNQIKKILN